MMSDHEQRDVENSPCAQYAQELNLRLTWGIDRIRLVAKFPSLRLLLKTAKKLRPPPRIGLCFIKGKKVHIEAVAT